jgi:Immunity protein 35
MLSRQEAIAAVECEIAKFEPLLDGDAWVVYPEEAIERPSIWIVFYGSRLHAQTGDDRYAVAGNAPFIVNRRTGEVATTGTAHPVQHYIDKYESGEVRHRGPR